MPAIQSEACVRAISSAGTPPERRFDPAVALAFGYNLRARRGTRSPRRAAAYAAGLMMCLYAAAVRPGDFQRLSPRTAFQNASARPRHDSRSAR